MFERFTDRARKVMALANQEAQRFNHEYIGTEHILLGLVKEGSGVGANVLKNLDVDLRKVRLEVEKLVHSGPEMVTMGKLPQTPRAKKVIEYAIEEARNLNHNYVGTEHLLLGLLREHDGVAAQVLMNLGLKLEEVREEVLNLLGAGMDKEDAGPRSGPAAGAPRPPGARAASRARPPRSTPSGATSPLAREGQLDPVIGREREIERVIQVLCRTHEEQPGPAGRSGRRARLRSSRASPRRSSTRTCPTCWHDRRLVVLDLAMMVAGTKYRGQFEERIKAVMNEVRRAAEPDPVHRRAAHAGGRRRGGGRDRRVERAQAGPLSAGEMQCIGATTSTSTASTSRRTRALASLPDRSRGSAVTWSRPIEILKGLRDRYEEHHRVKITDDAIRAAVELSGRYIPGRVQPDKSIDVIDEAGARVRLKTMTKPPDLAELESEIERLSVEKDEAVKNADYERAAELRDQAEKLRKEKERTQREWRDKAKESGGVVDEEVIAEVVSKMTGVPLTRLEKEEAQRLLQLEDELHKRVVSQDEAIKSIAKAIRRARAGLKDPKRPMGSFVFVGPSGVGKTLLSKALAEFMFGDEEALIMLDMSDYMEKHNVSRLVGAPPGYVGYEEGGQLTEQIRRRPYSVVLLDEIEKAHPDVFNMLLQIMEEGRLVDSFGRNVDFRNTILIMTSNIGADLIKGGGGFGFSRVQRHDDESDFQNIKGILMKEIERYFRPEFINRLDDVIVFRPLTKENLETIVLYETGKLRERMKEQGWTLELSDTAREFLIDNGYNPDFGARPLRRAIAQHIEDPLSEALLSGEFHGKNKIVVAKAEGEGEDAERLIFHAEHDPALDPPPKPEPETADAAARGEAPADGAEGGDDA
jgi:ATP-dependent Clp protease ATP-binding subunit ClpC